MEQAFSTITIRSKRQFVELGEMDLVDFSASISKLQKAVKNNGFFLDDISDYEYMAMLFANLVYKFGDNEEVEQETFTK